MYSKYLIIVANIYQTFPMRLIAYMNLNNQYIFTLILSIKEQMPGIIKIQLYD